MKRLLVGFAALGATVALAASAQAAVTCGQIQAAIKAGKSEQQVAKDLKVSMKRVKQCNRAPVHHAPAKKAK